MSLRLRLDDLTSHGGWFFNLRSHNQQPMTLDVSRGQRETGSFPIRDGFVHTDDGKPISSIESHDAMYVIEKPDSLMEAVRNPASLAASCC